jgi:hypothetical protein
MTAVGPRSDLEREVAQIERRRRVQRGPDDGDGLTGPFENPLKEIPRSIEQIANARPSGVAILQPQRWTLKQVFAGRAE